MKIPFKYTNAKECDEETYASHVCGRLKDISHMFRYVQHVEEMKLQWESSIFFLLSPLMDKVQGRPNANLSFKLEYSHFFISSLPI